MADGAPAAPVELAQPAKSEATPEAKADSLKPQMPEGDFAEAESGPIRWGSVFRWAGHLVAGAPLWVAAETLMTLAGSLLLLYNAQVFAAVISALQGAPADAGTPSLLAPYLPHSPAAGALTLTGLTIFLILLGYATRILGAWVDNRMVGQLRQEIHDKLLTLGPEFHEKFNTGRATLLVTAFTYSAQIMLKEVITGPVVRLFSFAFALFFLVVNLKSLQQQDNVIQIILLIGLVGLPIIGWFLAARLRTSFARARDRQAELTEEFLNSLYRPNEIQLLNAAPQRARAFARRVQAQIRDQVAAAIRHEIANDFQAAMPTLLQVAIVLYGVFVSLRSGNTAAAGAIVALYVIVPQVVDPIQQILQIAAGFTSSWPQVEAVLDVLETEPEEGDGGGTLKLEPSDRSVSLKEVTFRYGADHPKILEGVSHVFPAGKVSAVVARFGTGKSTVLNLVARLRHPQPGTILIGDKDLQHVSLASLRRNVVKVSQFFLLISDSARENFKLAKANATDAEIESVCRRTGLWDVLVKETPPGGDPLDYRVERQEDIGGLSGGQRRMFAVTRALLLEPTILLLDEPTTGIDPIGRQELGVLLAKACVGLTVMVVDQDMNFIAHFADQVCCLEGGKFVDVGAPAELMQRESLFRRLSQASQ